MKHFIDIQRHIQFLFYSIIAISISSCSKLIDIAPPLNTITTEQTFADSANASAAIHGTYSQLYYSTGSGTKIGSGFLTEFGGLYTDELSVFANDYNYVYFRNNVLPSTMGMANNFWAEPYGMIYHINACIEGVTKSTGLSARLRDQFLGELKFQRAFLYFYLVHLFGDVPYVTSTAFKETLTIGRTPVPEILSTVESDLQEAFEKLLPDYAISNGEKVRFNKWCAAALLARVYLYQKKWQAAEAEATKVISQNGLYSMCDSLKDVFKPNSPEAIFQFYANTSIDPYNVTFEGLRMNVTKGAPPNVFVTTSLLNSFSAIDQRRLRWLDSTAYLGTTYYYPFKYKTGSREMMPNAPAIEYYTVLRLAEQYLIRAEARVEQNKIDLAMEDLNVTRKRAGLPAYQSDSKEAILGEIFIERRCEFFAEWGHRFFDLKRTGRIDVVLGPQKPEWKPYKKLLPIPLVELQKNSKLTQNPFY